MLSWHDLTFTAGRVDFIIPHPYDLSKTIVKRIAPFVKAEILFYGEGGFARSAERARSRLWSAPGAPSTTAPVQLPDYVLPNTKPPPHGGGFVFGGGEGS